MHINLTSLLTDQQIGAGRKSPLSANPQGDFLSMIGNAMPTGSKATFFIQRQGLLPSQTGNAKTGADFLAAFRSGLLSKGKPFDQVYLDPQGLPLLAKLMQHSGYSPEHIAESLQNLKANNHGGKIKVSRIWAQLDQLPSPEDEQNIPVIIDSEAVPYLESVLRAFGLSPNAVSTVLNNGRTPQGDLDFETVIKAIETAANPATRRFPGIVDLQKSQTIVSDLKRLAIQVPVAKKTGFVHIEDFLTAFKRLAHTITNAAKAAGETEAVQISPKVLENLTIQMPQTGGHATTTLANNAEHPMATDGLQGQAGIPPVVQTIINRLLEQVGSGQEKSESLTSIISDSKIQFDDPVTKQLQADRARAQQAALESQRPKNQQQMPDLDGQKISDPEQIGKLQLAPETIASRQRSEKVSPKILDVTSNVQTGDVNPDPLETRRLEIFAFASHKNQKPSTPLPNYLMDQMGRQIARAIHRGDGVIRFQLKPPEMGIVKLEMHLTDNQLNLAVAAENSSVKELLLANIQELRETLQMQGIKIDKLDIQLNNDFNQSLANFQEGQQKESRAGSGDRVPGQLVNHDESADDVIHTRASPRNDSTIELVA